MSWRKSELAQALGFHLLLLPPGIVAIGARLDLPWLAVGILLGVLPLLRVVFGECDGEPPEWSERVAGVLEAIPVMASVVYLLALPVLAEALRKRNSWSDLAGFGTGLWAASLLTSCVAHELLHRRGSVSRFLGRILSGALGYPLLEHEHAPHHARSGTPANAECPLQEESIWRFSIRRLVRVAVMAYESDLAESLRAGHRLAGGLMTSSVAFIGAVVTFGFIAGQIGVVLYMASAFLTSWSLQAVTYLQHWAMSERSVVSRGTSEFCWEDRCQVQAWITLGICFHQAHHRTSTVPYYRLAPSADAPRQPAGYLILLLIALVPPLWRLVAGRALRRWMIAPTQARGAGRSLVCFSGGAKVDDTHHQT